MSIEDWPCQLIAQRKDTNPQVSESVILENAPTKPYLKPHLYKLLRKAINYNLKTNRI
jgi:hypothetical protein